MTTPDPRRIRAVQRRLRLHQGAFIPKPPLPIIDEVVATVLSSSGCRIASRCTSPRRRTAIGSWAWVISVTRTSHSGYGPRRPGRTALPVIFWRSLGEGRLQARRSTSAAAREKDNPTRCPAPIRA
jgi:hypothetical protein